MKLHHRISLRNVLAGTLSAVMVLSSCPSTVLATDEVAMLETVLAGQDASGLVAAEDVAPEVISEFTDSTEEEAVADLSADVVLSDDAGEDSDDGVVLVTEDSEEALEEDAFPEEDAFGVVDDDIISENDALIATEEDGAFVEESILEAAGAFEDEARVKGKRTFFYTNFTAKLTGFTVKVAASNLFVKSGSEMQVKVLSGSEYTDVIEAQNYGKVVTGAYEIQLAFFDAKGREFTPVGLDVTIESKKMDAESYTLFRANRNSVRRIGSSFKPIFDFYSSYADTYIIAGLQDDGALRVAGTKKSGNTVFKLNKDEIGLTVTAPKGAFFGNVSMEVMAVDESLIIEQIGSSDIMAAEAYDLSFHADSAEEIEPNKDVEVMIYTENEVDETCKVFHIKDDGEAEEVPIIKRTENSVTFLAGSFSTYALTWGEEGSEESATIHWGTLVDVNNTPDDPTDDTFEEFNAASLDTSTGVMSLDALFSGYMFRFASYSPTELTDANPTQGTSIGQTITQDETTGVWTYTTTSGTGNIADGSHIYVVYWDRRTLPSTVKPPEILPAAEPDPLGMSKSVRENNIDPDTGKGDGTYRITLQITGAVETTYNIKSANVVVVIDRSSSMVNNMGGEAYAAVKTAAQTLVDKMPPKANVDITVFEFAKDVHGGNIPWTTLSSESVKASVKTTIGNFVKPKWDPGDFPDNGTNWDQALAEALSRANAKKNAGDNDPTYIIFMTDGCPSRYGNPAQGDVGPEGTGNINSQYITRPLASMRSMVDAGYKVYGIYANSADALVPYEVVSTWWGVTENRPVTNSQGQTYGDPLAYMIDQTHAEGYERVQDTTTLQTVFGNIASAIASNLGYTDVAVNDGITALTDVSAMINGATDNFVYYRKGGVVRDPEHDNEIIEGRYKYSNEGLGETWAAAPTASVTDTGVKWDLSSIGALEEGVTYTVQFDVWPSQESYDILADLNNGVVIENGKPHNYGSADEAFRHLPTDVQNQLEKIGNVYYLKTNTFLNATYTHGNTYEHEYSEGTGKMDLDDTYISIRKLWHNYLDTSHTDNDIDGLQMVLTRDGKECLEFEVGPDDDPDKNWKKDQVHVSIGLLVGTKVVEPGHDYYVTEKPKTNNQGQVIDKTEYWEINSPIYHPMVVNKQVKMYIRDDTASGSDVAFEIEDPESEEVAKYVLAPNSDTSTLEAINERASWLNVMKKGGTGINPDAFFEFKVTINEEDSENVYFSVFGDVNYQANIQGTNISEYVESGNTYYKAPVGTEFTFKVKPEWNVRILNLKTGSTYKIVESESTMPAGYAFDHAEYVETLYKAKGEPAEGYPTDPPIRIDTNNITGTINQTNTDYKITVYNKPLEFYIYHSSVENGAVETISFTDTEKFNPDGKTFNLHSHAFTYDNANTYNALYGGYYLYYEGKGTYKDGIPGTGGAVYDGVSQVWSNAQSENGKAMTPLAGVTYYIKEVPTSYLQNYIHYIYNLTYHDVTGWYLISALDDLNYNETGFYLDLDTTDRKTCLKDNNPPDRVKVVARMRFKNNQTGAINEITPFTCFNEDMNHHTRINAIHEPVEGKDNDRLTYYDTFITKKYCAVNSQYTMQPYWVTPDSIEVTGTSIRTITIGAKLNLDYITFTESIGDIFTSNTSTGGGA